jgi:DNA-binding response OmpR family regulator
MENALPTPEATARVLVISADDEVKTFINNLMRINRIRAGLTDSIENASHFLNTNVPPDAVILDLEPSETLALEFLRQIRRHETLVKLPVLVLMPIPDPTLVRQALDAGANRYLTKAFMSQNLLPTIQEILKQIPPPPPRQTASLRQSAAISTDPGG